MSEWVLTPEPTPNPKAYKFTANRPLCTGPSRCFYSPGEARDDPVASKLFELPGVVGVMMLNDFCTVNQDGSADWDELIPRIQDTLRNNML